jgi:hypothetical protein
VSGWPRQPFAVLVTGLETVSEVTLDGEVVELAAPHSFEPSSGLLILWLDGPRTIGLEMVPRRRSEVSFE